MKMTLRGCCVLVYDCSGDPVVRSDELELPRPDMSCSKFEIAAPTSEEECEKKRKKGALKFYLRIGCSLFYIAVFYIDQWLICSFFAGSAE